MKNIDQAIGATEERANIVAFLREEADRHKGNGEEPLVWTAVLDCARFLEGGGPFNLEPLVFDNPTRPVGTVNGGPCPPAGDCGNEPPTNTEVKP